MTGHNPIDAARYGSVGVSDSGLAMRKWHSRRISSTPLRVIIRDDRMRVEFGVGHRSPGDPEKPTQVCLAVEEVTPLAMRAADGGECERTMRAW